MHAMLQHGWNLENVMLNERNHLQKTVIYHFYGILRIGKSIETKEELPRWLSGKESTCQCWSHQRFRFDLWAGRIPGGGNGNPLQHSCWDNLMVRGAWQATVGLQRVGLDLALTHTQTEGCLGLRELGWNEMKRTAHGCRVPFGVMKIFQY